MPCRHPLQAGMVWTKKDCPDKQESAENCTLYRALVALANFIANWTRPDLTHTVNKLCKFMSNPGPAHWQALKHLLRYLQGTKRQGLSYNFAESKVPGSAWIHRLFIGHRQKYNWLRLLLWWCRSVLVQQAAHLCYYLHQSLRVCCTCCRRQRSSVDGVPV